MEMNKEVIITCAITGAGDTVGKSDKVPVTPQQVADAAIEAAQAGAAVAHIHVRDPQTGLAQKDRDPLFPSLQARARPSPRLSVADTKTASGFRRFAPSKDIRNP